MTSGGKKQKIRSPRLQPEVLRWLLALSVSCFGSGAALVIAALPSLQINVLAIVASVGGVL